MLPDFEVFESISSAKFSSDFSVESSILHGAHETATDFGNLLPSLANFRSQVAKVARQQRRADEIAPAKLPSSVVVGLGETNVWGDPRNGRSFCLQADGSAAYEFRAGETLRAVVIDLLSECQKTASATVIDFPTIRAVSGQILSYNGIADADLINAGASIGIPSHLVPKKKFSA
ncbi:hypothetical protein BH11CYA1_BH11CYA1_44270 [soil metagenome]